jgi:hypothetical protein
MVYQNLALVFIGQQSGWVPTIGPLSDASLLAARDRIVTRMLQSGYEAKAGRAPVFSLC